MIYNVCNYYACTNRESIFSVVSGSCVSNTVPMMSFIACYTYSDTMIWLHQTCRYEVATVHRLPISTKATVNFTHGMCIQLILK